MSGGADSLALTLLANSWARARGGSILALSVDHGLRIEAAAELAAVIALLAARGIAGRVLTLRLMPGARAGERARRARYAALTAACAAEGIVHLLLGHHAADQAETVALRRAAGSGEAGLAGMAALVATSEVLLLRPLLDVAPGRLRAVLRREGVAWIEDPSNADPSSPRARVRATHDDPDGSGPVTAALVAEAAAHGLARAAREVSDAAALAASARFHPEGYAVLSPTNLPSSALAALLRTIGGAEYPIGDDAAVIFAGAPGPATVGGVRRLAAGRHGGAGDWIVCREDAAMAEAVEARGGAVWDGRFRLHRAAASDCTIGALGADAALLPPRVRRHLPAAVVRTLPAIRLGSTLVAVPHLQFPDDVACAPFQIVFAPPVPAAGAPFVSAARRSEIA